MFLFDVELNNAKMASSGRDAPVSVLVPAVGEVFDRVVGAARPQQPGRQPAEPLSAGIPEADAGQRCSQRQHQNHHTERRPAAAAAASRGCREAQRDVSQSEPATAAHLGWGH